MKELNVNKTYCFENIRDTHDYNMLYFMPTTFHIIMDFTRMNLNQNK